MNNFVYLYELDSVCNSSKEIEFAMKSLYKTLVVDGDILVLTLNQFADSMLLMSIVNNAEMNRVFNGLIEQEKIVLSRFRLADGTEFFSPVQYIVYKIDSYLRNSNNKFIFSAVECFNNSNETLKVELLKAVKKCLENHSNNDFEELLDKDTLGLINEIDSEYMKLLMCYLDFLKDISDNKIKKLKPKENRMGLWQCIKEVAKENVSESLKTNLDYLMQNSNNKSDRSSLLEFIQTHINQYERDEVERVINICYNLSVESSISGIESVLEIADKKTYFLEKMEKTKKEYKVNEHRYGCKTSNPPLYVFSKKDILSWQSVLRIICNLNGCKKFKCKFIENLYKKTINTPLFKKTQWKSKILIYLIILTMFVLIEVAFIFTMLFGQEGLLMWCINKSIAGVLISEQIKKFIVIILCELMSSIIDTPNLIKFLFNKDIREDFKNCCKIINLHKIFICIKKCCK